MSLNTVSVNEKSGVIGADVLVSREKLIINGNVTSNSGHPITFITDVTLSNVDVTGNAVFEGTLDLTSIGVQTEPVLTLKRHLGNGNDGEGIAFNPNDGLLYHVSGAGSGNQYFETVNRETLVVGPNLVAGNTYPGALAGKELTAIAWYEPIGKFLVAARAPARLFSLEADGSASVLLGSLPSNSIRGFAVYGTKLFGGDAGSGIIYEFNPSTGAILRQVQAKLADGTIIGGVNGMSVCVDRCRSYVIYADPLTPGLRSLGTVNFDTGVVTFVFGLGDLMAGMVFDDVQETLWVVSGDGADVPETLYSIEGMCDDIQIKVPLHMNGNNLCDAGIMTASHLNCDTVYIPGPYANDAAALAAGVKSKGLYYDMVSGRHQVFILP